MKIEEARKHCETEIADVTQILRLAEFTGHTLTPSEAALFGIVSTVATLGLIYLDRLEAENRTPISVQVHVPPSSGDTDNVQAVPVAYGTPETTA